MNRYEIALKNKELPSCRFFRFPKSGSIPRVIRYIDHCIYKKAVLIADNISEDILNSAIIESCRKYNNVPLIVPSEDYARMFSISYSYKYIFSYDTIPDNVYITTTNTRNRFVMCYNTKKSLLPDCIPVLVTIYSYIS